MQVVSREVHSYWCTDRDGIHLASLYQTMAMSLYPCIPVSLCPCICAIQHALDRYQFYSGRLQMFNERFDMAAECSLSASPMACLVPQVQTCQWSSDLSRSKEFSNGAVAHA